MAGMLISAGIMFSCTSRVERRAHALSTFLDSLEQVHAPDTRVSLWQVEIQSEGEVLIQGMLGDSLAYASIASFLQSQGWTVRNELELLTGSKGQVINAVVNNSVMHLRREPSSKSELVSQALLGSPVNVLKEVDGKLLVQVADGYLGWVNAPEVHLMEQAELARYRSAGKLVYAAQSGFAYSTPSEGSLPVSDLVRGNILVVEGAEGNFFKVVYPDGREGYVKGSEILGVAEVFFHPATGEDLVQTALPYHGTPYLWGGASSKNLDCSGLVSNVFFMNGLQMPRDADMQSHSGRVVSTRWDSTGLEAGDLLFFGRKATPEREEGVSHVAIYMGGGEYIHASGYGERVSINSMDSTQAHYIESYPEMFLRAVRIIGEKHMGSLLIFENPFYREIIDHTPW